MNMDIPCVHISEPERIFSGKPVQNFTDVVPERGKIRIKAPFVGRMRVLHQLRENDSEGTAL